MSDTNVTDTNPAAPAPVPSPAEQMVSSLAAERLASLTESQRSAVLAVAGQDPIKQLETVRALVPTWTARDTAPPPAAPREQNSNTSTPDMQSIYENLKSTNPVIAARFYLSVLAK